MGGAGHQEHEARRAREARFFDAGAGAAASEGGPDRFVKDLLRQLPRRLDGLRVLDCGCGEGDLTRWLSARGGRVVGLDLSAACLARARARSPRSAFVRGALEALPFAGRSFDLVVGSLVLHHLPVGRAAPELARVLVPGGRAVFSENFGLNPLLRLARRFLAGRLGVPRLGTADEKPIDRADLALLARHFRVTLSFAEPLLFHLADRQLFGYRRRAVSRACWELDRWLFRGLPALRHWAYRGTLVLEPVPRGQATGT